MRTGIPDLCLYPLIFNCDYAGGELDADRRPAIGIEFIAYEAGEHCGDEMSSRTITAPHSAAYVQFLRGQKRCVKP